MTNINEDYVSFEIAKLLKKKGFDSDDCFAFYNGKGEIKFLQTFSDIADYDEKTSIVCPTLQMAMKWLRDVHNIHIEIPLYKVNQNEVLEDRKNLRVYYTFCMIQTETGDFLDERSYNDGVYTSPEQASEAAIKYCLKNLVKDEQKPINSTLEEKSRIDDAFTKMMLKKPTE